MSRVTTFVVINLARVRVGVPAVLFKKMRVWVKEPVVSPLIGSIRGTTVTGKLPFDEVVVATGTGAKVPEEDEVLIAEGTEMTVVMTVCEPDASVFVNVTSEVMTVIEEMLVGASGPHMLPSSRVMVRIGTVTTVSVVIVDPPILVTIGEVVEEEDVGELLSGEVSIAEDGDGELPGVIILDGADEGPSVNVERVPPTSVVIVDVVRPETVMITGRSSSSSWAPSRSQRFVRPR